MQVAILQTRQVQEQEDFNLALNVGRPPGPWFPDSARRSKCGLPGCILEPRVAHQGFCSPDHHDRALSRGLLAPPSDEAERCFLGPSGDFSCLLLTRKSKKRADIVVQFQQAWRKHAERPPRVEHVYEIVPPPQVRERFDRYATSVGNVRRRFHGTSSTCDFGTSLSAAPCAAPSCCLCSILSSGFSLGKAGTGPNRCLRVHKCQLPLPSVNCVLEKAKKRPRSFGLFEHSAPSHLSSTQPLPTFPIPQLLLRRVWSSSNRWRLGVQPVTELPAPDGGDLMS